MQLPRFYLVSRRKPCWNAPGNWNFFSKPSKETVITPFSMVVTFPVPKALCVTMEPGLYSRCRRSPPRMRGRGSEISALTAEDRITPAYAGKSYIVPIFKLFHGDHPRVCGEEALKAETPAALMGSPPRMRGRGSCATHSGCARRITPAYAGKSSLMKKKFMLWRDHPRVRGEEMAIQAVTGTTDGSPPHARGREIASVAGWLQNGITPACAGKSSGPPP